jgi:hypothetical protein
MADDITLPVLNVKVATDDDGTRHFQWTKVVWGPDDTFNKVDDAAGKRLPVLAGPGENHIGEAGWAMDVIDVALTLAAATYTSGNVLSDTATVSNAMRVIGGKGILRSITVIDEDDQGAALDLLFFKLTQSLGTKNAAPTISDASARDCLGFISVVAGDYIDLGGVRVASKSGLGLALESDPASRDLFVATITRGTPTYTASGLRLKLGIEQG